MHIIELLGLGHWTSLSLHVQYIINEHCKYLCTCSCGLLHAWWDWNIPCSTHAQLLLTQLLIVRVHSDSTPKGASFVNFGHRHLWLNQLPPYKSEWVGGSAMSCVVLTCMWMCLVLPTAYTCTCTCVTYGIGVAAIASLEDSGDSVLYAGMSRGSLRDLMELQVVSLCHTCLSICMYVCLFVCLHSKW